MASFVVRIRRIIYQFIIIEFLKSSPFAADLSRSSEDEFSCGRFFESLSDTVAQDIAVLAA